MKKLILLLFTLILCLGTTSGKEGKIKYGKYVIYEGLYDKVNKEEIPMGHGIISVFSPNDKKQIMLSIEGDFNQNNIKNSIIVLENEVEYHGEASFSFGEDKELKRDAIEIVIHKDGAILVRGEVIYKDVPLLENGLLCSTSEQAMMKMEIEKTLKVEFDTKNKAVLVFQYPDSIPVSISDCEYTISEGTFNVSLQGTIYRQQDTNYKLIGAPIEGIAKLNNGAIYEGSFYDEKKYKNGTYKDSMGNTYSGTFGGTNNSLGTGKMTKSNGDTAEGDSWYGTVSNLDKVVPVTGTCDWHYPHGHFKGEIKHGTYQKGIYETSSGDRYNGTWDLYGKFNTGTTDIHSVDTIIGTWNESRFVSGYSNAEVNGGYFRGQWKDDQFFGYGKTNNKLYGYPFSSFEGCIKGDTLQGKAKFEDFSFEGLMIKDKPEGECEFLFNDEGTLKGLWEDSICKKAEFSIHINADSIYNCNIRPSKEGYTATILWENKPFLTTSLVAINADSYKTLKNEIIDKNEQILLKEKEKREKEILLAKQQEERELQREKERREKEILRAKQQEERELQRKKEELEKKYQKGRVYAQKYLKGHTFSAEATKNVRSPFSGDLIQFTFYMSMKFISEKQLKFTSGGDSYDFENGSYRKSATFTTVYDYHIDGNNLELIDTDNNISSGKNIVIESVNKIIWRGQSLGDGVYQNVIYWKE